jgi:voltage-gated potassium channel
MRGPAFQLFLIFALLSTVLIAGTLGFRLVEGWGWSDSVYMSLTTLTTVGYSEVNPLSPRGRLFNSFFILAGVLVVFTSIGLLVEVAINLELADYFGRKRRHAMLQKLTNHYIVCGAGRVGRGVVRELMRSGAALALVDNDPQKAQWGIDLKIPTLVADASHDDALRTARIDYAKGLVAVTGNDAQNVYVILTARVLNPKLVIAARATEEGAEEKLRRAGATTVFTPYTFIGHRLAQSMLRPHVMSFLDVASALRGSDLDLEIEQIRVSEASPVAGGALERSRIRSDYDVMVLAVIKPQGNTIFNPAGSTLIEAQDVLIALGERSRLKKLEKMLEA